MTLKSASFLALIGTLLVTVLVAVHFFDTVAGVSRGIVPAIAIVPCVIYLFAGIAVTAFLWTFHKSQRWPATTENREDEFQPAARSSRRSKATVVAFYDLMWCGERRGPPSQRLIVGGGSKLAANEIDDADMWGRVDLENDASPEALLAMAVVNDA
jgi:hypothetical protein